MENTTAAITLYQISEARENPASRVLRRCGKLLVAGLKSIGAAYCDPRICSAYWFGTFPELWDSRK